MKIVFIPSVGFFLLMTFCNVLNVSLNLYAVYCVLKYLKMKENDTVPITKDRDHDLLCHSLFQVLIPLSPQNTLNITLQQFTPWRRHVISSHRLCLRFILIRLRSYFIFYHQIEKKCVFVGFKYFLQSRANCNISLLQIEC